MDILLKIFRVSVAVVVLGAAGVFLVDARAGTEFGWDGTSYVRNEERGYDLRFGGRVVTDGAWVSADDGIRGAYPSITDGSEIRSARLVFQGFVHHVVDYKLQVELAGRLVGFRDAYMGLRGVPGVGAIRVGNQKEMFSLEQLMSLKRIAFVERSVVSALAPGRNLGVGLGRAASRGRFTVTAGVFRNSEGGTSYAGSRYNGTLRFTAAPVLEAGSGNVVHVGIAGSLRQAEIDPADGRAKLRYSTQPESNLSPELIDTGEFEADAAAHLGAEVAAIWDRASAQGEYVRVGTDAAESGDPVFSAMYVLARYTLTGERRAYRGGVVQGLEPRSRFDGRGGGGAWEVAVRYSFVDLNDGRVRGGKERNITAALNWYLSAETRLMLNYTYADVIDVGTAHQVVARFQVVF